jgi:hypothetical protein
MSNGAVAAKVCGAAAVVTTAWCSWGWWLHNKVMDAANAHERSLAAELRMDEKARQALFAFDRSHPNNEKYFEAQDAAGEKEKEEEEVEKAST